MFRKMLMLRILAMMWRVPDLSIASGLQGLEFMADYQYVRLGNRTISSGICENEQDLTGLCNGCGETPPSFDDDSL